jgi:glucosamine--fructose-6-phosphate aminotransferase (isomerizing)
VTASTPFLQDISRQRPELPRTIDHLAGPGQKPLQRASSLIHPAPDVFPTGIGASWNAAHGAGTVFSLCGRPLCTREAGELLHVTAIPRGSVVIATSRTGRSIEIVQLLAKAEASGATVIGVTNCADSPLARESTAAIVAPTMLDHTISVNAYSSLFIAASALANSLTTGFASVARSLLNTVDKTGQCLELRQEPLEDSSWLASNAAYYFLACGGGIGTCHQAQLLWEEGVRMPATAMSTSGFRHGPQEIVKPGMRFCLWIDHSQMRNQYLAVAHDLRKLGASVMLVGERLPQNSGDLVCQLPPSPPHWQFANDRLPIQLAAEGLARPFGVDCDSFRICSCIVEDEHRPLHDRVEAAPYAD